MSLFSFIPAAYHKPPSTSNTCNVFIISWFVHELMSPVPISCIEKKSVGVFTPTSPNLSKHAGFQTIQRRAKETRQTGPGVMLSQQQMSDLKGRRGFVGNLHTRDSESFRGRLWAAGGHAFGSGRTLVSLVSFSNVPAIILHFKRVNERKVGAFARG